MLILWFARFQLCLSAVPGLTDFLQAVLIWDRALVGVFSTLFAAILVESKHSLHKVGMSSRRAGGRAGGAHLIQIAICSADESCRVLVFEDDSRRGGDGAGVHRRDASAVRHAAVCHPQIAVCDQVKDFSFVGPLVEA